MNSTLVPDFKVKFGSIADLQKRIQGYFELLQQRTLKIKEFHSEFVKNSKSEIFVFGLDSLNFQCKLIDLEYEDLRRLYLAINNHMYCEYFKLYKIIVSYILHQSFDKKIVDLTKGHKFPVYKDLEPFKEYDFVVVNDIHETILLLLNAILGFLEGKEHELQFHTAKRDIGLNIDNFISSFEFDLKMIREKINLFFNYLAYFHKLHLKQLQRFCTKIQSLHSHVNKDIKFDEAIQVTDSIENNMIQNVSPLNSGRIIDDSSSDTESEVSVEAGTTIIVREPCKEENCDVKEDLKINEEIIIKDDDDLPGITMEQVNENI